jgi:Fur family ferric uptake transcriptional regulator
MRGHDTLARHSATDERLRRLGLRVTPQRLLVVEALTAHGGHMTADEIMRWTAERYPAINLATIYRTLDLLASVGLVTHTDLGGGVVRYELAGETAHHHLVCERCGAVTELDDAALAPIWERLLRDYGFRASSRHLALFGLCRACYEKDRSHSPSGKSPQR